VPALFRPLKLAVYFASSLCDFRYRNQTADRSYQLAV